MPDPPNVIEHARALTDDLAADHRVVCLEAPGFGFSAAKKGFAFGLDEQARVLIEVLEALGLTGATLAFTCVPAFTGLRVAHLRPDLVGRLVLAQTPSLAEARSWARRVDFRGAVGTPFVGQFLMRALGGVVARAWYKNALPNGAARDPYLSRALDSFKDGARFSLASAFQALNEEPDDPARLAVERSVHVVWGGDDRTHRRTDKESLRAYAPAATFETWSGCGHFPDLEMPTRFAATIRAAEAAG
jgi:pimeloyl-ACP methyl ester carboxylesterase